MAVTSVIPVTSVTSSNVLPPQRTDTTRSPFAALMQLHDVSKELQKSYRDSALESQQKIYDTTLKGIVKARSAQQTGFILQMIGSGLQLAGGVLMLGMSVPAVKTAFSRTKALMMPDKATLPASADVNAGAGAGAGAATPAGVPVVPPATAVVSGKLSLAGNDTSLLHSQIMAINAVSSGAASLFSNGGNYAAKLGEFEQQELQAMAGRESQLLDLRNGQLQEQGANAREIRDSIRSIIPNRSFHA